MTLPGGALSSPSQPSPVLPPDDRDRADLTIDYELGGRAIGDPTQGLQFQIWSGYVIAGTVYAAPETIGAPVALFSDAGITEISLAFDQNMHATVAYVAAGVAKLYWYDTALPGQTTTTFAGISSPFLTLDDKRPSQLGASDMLLFYIRAGNLYYRQQRDRFGVEYLLTALPIYAQRIVSVGMGRNLRMQVEVTGGVSAAHSSLEADTFYVAAGSEVLPLFDGVASTSAVWRSRVFVADEEPSMGWAQVEADYPAVLRIFGDGRLFYTSPAITGPLPFRLPVGRFREWYVEVTAAARVVGVQLASDFADLE